MSRADRPWMKFYPADWRGDPALRMCSYAARGLWADLLSLMHEAAPYGHLLVNGKMPTPKQLAGLLGGTPKEMSAMLGELGDAGVYSVTEDGIIFSRRMVRDKVRDERDRANGKGGGNPSLKPPDNGGVNPPDKPAGKPPDKRGDKAHMPEARSQKPEGGESSSGISPSAASAAPAEPSTDDGSPPPGRAALAVAIIAEFDASRTAVYGQDQARPWPNSTDFPTACRWIDAGAGPDLCRAVFDALNAKLQTRGHRPRDLLRAFDSDVLRAVEMSRDPLKFPANPRSSDDKSPRFRNGWLQLAAELAAERDAPDPDPLALP